ncbi:M14 family zinc carboxypeptidase [candidate division KSB1 bacterium]
MNLYIKSILLIFIIPLFIISCSSQPGDIPTPASHFGFEIGEDKKLAHPDEVIEYLKKLEAASGRIVLEEVGRTTEDNPMYMTYISSESNIKNLEKYREMNNKLTDPRKISDEDAQKIILEGKAIVGINESIHATEVGPYLAGIRTAYRLTSENSPYINKILDNVILVLTPFHNPDGVEMVVDWWRKYVDTEYEGSSLPYLYHKYTGHDNNRDWYMFTQKETQHSINYLYNKWHPQIVVDQHQMGGTGARIFVPPFTDPWEPNIDPILQANVNMLGTFMQNRLVAKGYTGVDANRRYDSWTPGRAYHHYHGAVRILTETASVTIAAPIEVPPRTLERSGLLDRSLFFPLPWEGGQWTLGNIVDYTHEAAMAALENAALNREVWLSNFYQVFKNSVKEKEDTFAVIIPSEQKDPYTTKWMIDILRMGEVEVHKALEDFTVNGKNFETGSAVIFMNQPFYSFAKTLLEKQVYPELREYPGGPLKRPYDKVAHTLPLLMGVDVEWVDTRFDVKTEMMNESEVKAPVIAEGSAPNGYLVSHATNAMYIALNRFLKEGIKVYWTSENFVDGNIEYPAGTVIISGRSGKDDLIRAAAEELNFDLTARQSSESMNGYELDTVKVGLFKAWTGNMNEGWTRWTLEKFEFDMVSAQNDVFKEGELNAKFSAILFPNDNERSIVDGRGGNTPPEYQGGIGLEGVENLKQFVRNGGTLITFGNSNQFAINTFGLGVRNALSTMPANQRQEISAPGSILKTSNNINNPIAYGLPAAGNIFFLNQNLFEVSRGKVVSRYPNTDDLLLSGWLEGGQHIKGKANVVEASYGDGIIVLIGFDPVYRAQAQTTFRYIFNAMFYGNSKTGKISFED